MGQSEQGKLNHMMALVAEIEYLKTRIKPEDTGHIYTTISTLQDRVTEIKIELEEVLGQAL